MPRVRKGAARNKARKKLLKAARGYWGTKSRHKQQAKVALTRAGQFAYRDRRARRRDFRRIWITRITAACRMRGTRYSRFINGLSNAGILLNRKMLSQMAIEDPKAFDQIVKMAEEKKLLQRASNPFFSRSNTQLSHNRCDSAITTLSS